MDWSIKKTVKTMGLSSRTLRYYEARGLLAPKKHGGIRYYDELQRDRILQILRGKQFGFSLTEIKGLIEGRADSGSHEKNQACLDAQIRFLSEKKAEIEDALSQLAQLRDRGETPDLLAAPSAGRGLGRGRRVILANLHRATEFTGKRVDA